MYLILLSLVLLFMIYKNAFQNGKPHCNHFIRNVYLYLALTIVLCALFVKFYNSLLDIKQVEKYLLFSFVVTIISIIILATRPIFSKSGYILNHIVWLIFIASISFSLYPYYNYNVKYAMFMTTVIFLLMTSIVEIIPNLIKQTYKKMMIGMLFALIAIIISEFYLFFTNQYSAFLHKIISYIVIVLFSLFIVYDTSRLYDYAKQCVHSPNYPLLSTNLFLDVLNIFVRLVKR